MNKRFDFTKLNGFPLTQNRLAYMQESYRSCLGGLANMIGNLTIVSGCTIDQATNTVADGWIVYNGELIPFVGGGYSDYVVVQEDSTNLIFKDGSEQAVQFNKYAFCGLPATFAFASLKRIQPIRDMWSYGDLKFVKCTTEYLIANFVDGLGINGRAGWAMCDGRHDTDDLQGRMLVNYDARVVDPNNGIWDVLYNTMGATGGAKAVSLLINQMPSHDHVEWVSQADSLGGHEPVGYQNVIPNTFAASTRRTGKTGGNVANPNITDAHENRPPFSVKLFIQYIW